MENLTILQEILLGEDFFKKGKISLSLTLFDSVLEKEPDNYRALNNKGVVLSRLNDYEAAGRIFMEILDGGNYDPDVIVNLIHCFLNLSKLSEAAAYVETYSVYLSPADLRAIEEMIFQLTVPSTLHSSRNQRGPSTPDNALADIFKQIYVQNAWSCSESKSGPGSTLFLTETIRQILPMVIGELKVRSFLDIPCGDFNWMKRVSLNVDLYIGADIVDELVIINQNRYGNEFRRFLKLDIRIDKLPKVDLIFCRDCLGHLTTADIHQALFNMINSQSKYLVATTFPKRDCNPDIQTGMWRPINLEKYPFGLPPPHIMINEKNTEGNGHFGDKSLGLWETAVLRPSKP